MTLANGLRTIGIGRIVWTAGLLAAVGTARGAPEGGVDVPWTIVDSGPVIEVRLNGQGPFRFALDTGSAGHGLVSGALAARLKLPVVGKETVGDPSEKNSLRLDLVRTDSLELGALTFRDARLLVSTDAMRAAWKDDGVEGVLGFGLFAGKTVTLDYPAGRLRVDATALPDPDGTSVFSYATPNGVPEIRLAIGAVEFAADLDAGSPGGLALSEATAAKLEWPEPPRVVGKMRTAFNEAEVRAGRVRGTLVLGGIDLLREPTEIIPILRNANLGGRVLGRFRVTFDVARHRVRFEPGPGGEGTPAPRRRYGVMLRIEDDGLLVIEEVVPGSRAAEAGLKAGDRVVSINGRPVAELPPDRRRAPLGESPLRLVVARDGKPVEIAMSLDTPSPLDDTPGPVGRRFTKYDRFRDLPDLLDRVLRDSGAPAIAAAVVRSGKVTEQAVRGVRERGKEAPARIDDRFHIGSVGKTITSALVARLIDRGKLDWTTTLAQALPDLPMRDAYRGVTIEQLLRHRGGIPRYMNITKAQVEKYRGVSPEPIAQRAAFVRDLLQEEPIGAPGERMAYSNAGYALLGHVAERVGGKPYETLLQELVFAPLGMTRSGTGWPATPARPDQPRGHFDGPDGLRVQALDEYDMGWWLTPAGNLHASIEDLARFAADQLAGMRGKDGLLRAATYARLHSPPDVPPGEEAYAAGWEIVPEWTEEPFHGHAGSAGTFRCQIAIFAQRDLAVVAFVNSGGEKDPGPPLEVAIAIAHAAPTGPKSP